jgi:hypothetical protein
VKPELPPGSDLSRDAPRLGVAGEPPHRRWVGRGALATATVLVIAVTVANLMSRGGVAPTSSPPERGIACAQLEKAYDRRAENDQVGFLAALRIADQNAERALQESGVIFGAPERIALELQLTLSDAGKVPGAKIDRLMTAARDTCVALDRWLG